jgi:hypothetical protein
MPKISYEQEEEYRRLKTQRDALDQPMSKMTAYEAAMRLIARHNLMEAFAEEITAVTNGERQ